MQFITRNIKCATLIFLISLLGHVVSAQGLGNKDTDRLKEVVYTLSADSMLGREAGKSGEMKARNYLIEYFKGIGLSNLNESYIQEFKMAHRSSESVTASNVIGIIDNKSAGTIIIGAHYDHLGLGGSKSRSFTSGKIHNGADDNASGVAIMLMLAEHFQAEEYNQFNYLFIAFSGHEHGLYGSAAFTSEKLYDLTKVQLMINLDMVGRLNLDRPIVKITRMGGDDYLDATLDQLPHKNFELSISDNHFEHTDAAVFAGCNIASLSFTTGTHEDYHKISDVAEKINYEGMNKIATYVSKLVAEFDYKSLSKI